MKTPHQLSLFKEEKVSMSRVAQHLGISVSSVRRMLERGDLVGYQLTGQGGWWTILWSSVIELEARVTPANYQRQASPQQHGNGSK